MSPLFKQAITQSHARLNQAELHFKRPMPEIDIQFNLRGQAAGMVKLLRKGEILVRYNPILLNENSEHFLSQTVPHEIAHVVASTLNRHRIRPHGTEWQQIMQLFGADNQRCHSYEVKTSPRRQLARFNYRCGCREHQLTSIRHNRIINGQRYICRHCRAPLLILGEAD
ncbi:MAG: SprT-like domain-containing protein [Candidatus Polarisedimenticolaceae bacterium]|nr:SprT-like domain-containing protein [Candidatus Polarisedimenticolaceae bacterium]